MILKIDPEIRDLIPPLSADEFERLRASILAEGVRVPIVIWHGTIADGHNRYAIAREKAPEEVIPFSIKSLDGDLTLEEVKLWVINNQLGRRNLSSYDRAVLALKLKDVLAAQAQERMHAGKAADPMAPGPQGATRDQLGKVAGYSGRTMDKIEWIEKHADEETKARIRSGKTTVGAEHRRIKHDLKKAAAIDAVESKPEPLPDGPFDVLVADPPWAYELRPDDATHRGRTGYPPMSAEEIAALPVGELAADDAILWLWVTNSHLLDGSAATVLDAWGFEAKTLLTWNKPSIGAGHWLRGATEHAIMAVRGKPVHTLMGQSTSQTWPRREHSRKPEQFMELVESLCPGSKVELFAREQRDGWHAWGAEKGKFDE